MSFENMENLKNKKPQEGELELEMHAGPIKEEKRPMTPEEIHKHKMSMLNEASIFDLESEKPKTIKEKIQEAAQEVSPSIQAMAEEKVREIENKDNSFLAHSNKINERERREGDMGHLLMLEEKIKKLEAAIAQGGDYQQDLISAKQEYDKYFQEYSEKIKKESLNK